MLRISWSIGCALIGLSLTSAAIAGPVDMKPASPVKMTIAHASDRVIASAAAPHTRYWISGPTIFQNTTAALELPQQLMPTLAVHEEPRAASVDQPHPAASGFFALMSDIPQPGTLSMIAMGAALCRFGSSFLRIRR